MASALNDPFNTGGRGRRRRRARRGALSEINVTPLVDVMLVLLIIFMISAPLLTAGVPVELPKTDAGAVNDEKPPLTLTIRRDGQVFIQDTPIAIADLSVRLKALAGDGFERPIYVRADGGAPYEYVAQVMARLSTSGFTKIDLITDTGAPDRGPVAPPSAKANPSTGG